MDEHFENVLNRDRVAGKDIEENKKSLYLIQRRRGLYKNYLSDRSYDKKGT